MTADIRRGNSRFTDREVGRATFHAFSFGEVYDPAWLSFGPMVCHDEHLLGDGRGFPTHRHADLEIVTWVVSGAVRHEDSTGAAHTLLPGEVGHLHAGSGVDHSELAAAPQTRFVQVWLRPEALGTDAGPDGGPDAPSYAVHEVAPGPLSRALVVGGAVLHVARLAPQETVTLPPAPLVHAYVASGALLRHSLAEPLTAGDALLLRDEPGPVSVTAAVATELLVWALPAPVQTTSA